MFIIESHYGNDGYAFWFKLLELLATSHGHYFDANNPLQMEFLAAKTRLSSSQTTDLLCLLAQIEAIDKDLWEQRKVIWCQNLINNVVEVYENRKGLLPEKPYYDGVKLCQNIDNHTDNAVSSIHNTESKVKETKVDKTKVYNKAIISKSPFGEKLSELFARLDKERGYALSVKRKAEAASMMRMLKKEYTTDQIIETWRSLKSEPFYSDKELTMMTVEGQIGAKLNGRTGRNQTSDNQKQGKHSQSIPGNRPAGAFNGIEA
jgi:hypothetical protein